MEYKIALITDNSFIAYSALEVFYNSIFKTLGQLGHSVYRINAIEEFEQLSINKQFDFTINIGKYSFYRNNISLYDYYKIPHFNWIIDNPLKMRLDFKSSNINYIFIDKEFIDIHKNMPKFRTLFLPLGTEPNINEPIPARKSNDILFVGQIKSLDQIYSKIQQLDISQRKKVYSVIDFAQSNLHKSFVNIFTNIIDINNPKYKRDIKLLFELANSYIRAYKRKLVISSIVEPSIKIYGSVEDEGIYKQKNVQIQPPLSYSLLYKIYSTSKISLNVTPNFHYSCHDRIINSISCGACCLTDRNEYLDAIFEDMKNIIFYDFMNLDALNSGLSYVLQNNLERQICEAGLKVIQKRFSWAAILSTMLQFINERIKQGS